MKRNSMNCGKMTTEEALKDVFSSGITSMNYSPTMMAHRESFTYMKEKYDLTDGAVEVLAYLFRYYQMPVLEKQLRPLTDKYGESIRAVLGKLCACGYVTEKRMSSDDECTFVRDYELTKMAYKSFMNNRLLSAEDCLEELRDCEFSDIFQDGWFKVFADSFNLPLNNRFKIAYDSFELGQMGLDTQKLFWVFAKNFVMHFSETLKKDVLQTRASLVINLDDNLGCLVKSGLVSVLNIEDNSKVIMEYVLAPNAAGVLFHGHEEMIRYDELAKYAGVIKCENIVKKELFFSSDAQAEIDNLRTLLSSKGFERAKTILERKKRSKSVQSLLWGPPGTGKTEVVKQVALETKRDIIEFDMAKVTASAWGATERLYRALFRAYNYVAVISEKVPILLLNEADNILSKRMTDVNQSIEKCENTVANILLQEIENLNGILLATTNLIDNLDPAFDRRFLFKTRLIKPNVAARSKIWRSSIPELTEAEAMALAEEFEMSGAQINNVVTKRDLAELYFEGNRGYDYIVNLCKMELKTEDGSKSFRSRIGY